MNWFSYSDHDEFKGEIAFGYFDIRKILISIFCIKYINLEI